MIFQYTCAAIQCLHAVLKRHLAVVLYFVVSSWIPIKKDSPSLVSQPLYCQCWRFVSAVLDAIWSCPYVAIVYFTFRKVGVVFQRGVIRLIYCFVWGRSAQGFHIQYLIMLAREVGKQCLLLKSRHRKWCVIKHLHDICNQASALPCIYILMTVHTWSSIKRMQWTKKASG